MVRQKTADLIILLAALVALAAEGACPVSKDVVCGEPIRPVSVTTNVAGRLLLDFGRHAFGWLEVSPAVTGRYAVIWGELVDAGGSIVTNRRFTVDEGTIRCACTRGMFDRPGRQRIPYVNADNGVYFGRNGPVGEAEGRFGTIMPFRWVEIVELPGSGTAGTLRQVPVWYPYDMEEESFVSSCSALDRVHDFCKYTIKATSFLGRFVDGDRERLTYEADSLIAQLGSYAISSDYTVPRATLDWVSDHSTWPTEWKQFFVRMCWLDWMYTGDTSRIVRYYDLMRTRKIWTQCIREDGLLVTDWRERKGVNLPRDIVDWAMCYRDGFVFTPVNSVVNALRYRNLLEMRDMAEAIGKRADAIGFAKEAERIRNAYVNVLLDPKTGLVRDGEGTEHFTVQGNAMALSCGVLPTDRIVPVADYIVRKGMSCSTYMAQFVLEALCRSGREKEAIELMTTQGPRGWLAMLEKGATITTEFWDLTLAEPYRVPDMNHAWSTAPVNVVTRFLLGVVPLEPGFARIAVTPHPGSLSRLTAKVPTKRGVLSMRMEKTETQWEFTLDVPAPVAFEFGGVARDLSAGKHAFAVPMSGERDDRR